MTEDGVQAYVQYFWLIKQFSGIDPTAIIGISVGRENAQNPQLFVRSWEVDKKSWNVDKPWKDKGIQLQLDDEVHPYPLYGLFWKKCPEFRGGPLKEWLREKGFEKQGQTLELSHLRDNLFELRG